MTRKLPLFVALLVGVTLALVPVGSAQAGGSPPAALQFTDPYLTINPGSSATLNWPAPGAGEFFILASASPNALPNFGGSGLTWPPGSNASYSSTYQWWTTTSNSVTV